MKTHSETGLRPQAGIHLERAGESMTYEGPGFVKLDGVDHAFIGGVHDMAPFFMTIPSATDLWMYISSRGGLTAGRVSPEGALFPYDTVDRLHDARGVTGPVTIFRVAGADGSRQTWEPFAAAHDADENVERNLYKSVTGDRVVFEEVRRDLGLVFRYAWQCADSLGMVRSATLTHLGDGTVDVDLLDGLLNIMPSGVPLALMRRTSCLVDAYRRNELDAATGLALYTLSARIMDRPEAGEVLRANAVWSSGLDGARVSISGDAVDAFRRGKDIPSADETNGRRGAYLLADTLHLGPRESVTWHIVGEVARDHVQLVALRDELASGDLRSRVPIELEGASRALRQLVASTDGLQVTGDGAACVHHFANVLYNDMRGGVFANGHRIPRADLAAFLNERSPAVAARLKSVLDGLAEETTVPDLLTLARETADPDFERLALEYLPLRFGRRHGDPSRPWNGFVISSNGADASAHLRYEGNWRDIFQNWEALAHSHPGFTESMIAKFVNGTTVDGFNPARLDRSGVGWDEPDPDDPWSTIGYWNDHQVVYLTRLMELSRELHPGWLEQMLARCVFAHADVPYRIVAYRDIVADPRRSIVFERARAEAIRASEPTAGTDARLVRNAKGAVVHVSLAEKLLILALAKMSNLVIDGGIWMNTQRPEWNDANNVLAGHGLSVVTTCHLRRHLMLCRELLAGADHAEFELSATVADWLRAVAASLDAVASELDRTGWSPFERRALLDRLGEAFSAYRSRAYDGPTIDRVKCSVAEIDAFLDLAVRCLDRTIRTNRREDGLFHAYNVLDLQSEPGEARIGRLDLMLEGQVAALSSGLLESHQAIEVVEQLFASPLYRSDQASFLLQPFRDLPRFLQRNAVSEARAREIDLVASLLDTADRTIVGRGSDGVVRFGGDLTNADDLSTALDVLAKDDARREEVERDRAAVLEMFEEVFEHRQFTGRAERMYAYEGLGCIYWHMIAKLLLSVQECHDRAVAANEPGQVVETLGDLYYRVRAGLGFEKTALQYGAFPCDPYSHTPADGVARQPGMTGQVKEEVITRLGEVGVCFDRGRVAFRPRLLRRREFLGEAVRMEIPSAHGESRVIDVPARGLAFTLCDTPVIYRLVDDENAAGVRVTLAGTEAERSVEGTMLDSDSSGRLLARDGSVVRIDVTVPGSWITRG